MRVTTNRLGLVAVVLSVVATQAAAQASSGSSHIEEIIVTAQKREQRAQDVPVSLFAVSEEALSRSGTDTLEELSDLAAGVEIVAVAPGTVQMAFRGVTNLANGQLDSTAAVGYYIDETPISSFLPSELPDLTFWDVERVEVLRGPQGTLFGESSMGGTIRVITHRPDPSALNGKVVVGYERPDDGGPGYRGQAMLNVPLAEDQLALRLNASIRNLSGRIDIPDLGLNDANELDETRLGAALGWTPNDRLNVQFSYLYQETDLATDSTATTRGRYDPQSQADPGTWGPVGGFSPQDNKFQLANVTVVYQFDAAEIVSATSWFDLERLARYDSSMLLPLFFGAPGEFTNTWDVPVDSVAQELRLASIGDSRLNWTIGGFFKRNRRGGGQDIFVDIPDFGLTDTASQTFDVSIDSYALFGEIGYQFSDSWSVRAGGRYYSDDRHIRKEQLADSELFGIVAGTITTNDGSVDDFAPSFGVSWEVDAHLIYANVAKGFRAGGLNDNYIFNPDEIDPEYSPEELWTYETGSKNLLWNGQLQLNAYVYFNRWNDIQLSLGTTDSLFFTQNAGKAESLGGEIEIILAPTAELKIAASVGLNDGEIKETVTDSFGNIVIPKGNKIPFSPDTTFALSVDYSKAVAADMTALVNSRYDHRSSTYSDAQNFPEGKNASIGRLFLRFGLEKQSWGIYVSMDNVLNKSGTVYRGGIPPVELATFILPRTVLLEGRWSF